jgi:K+-sensing histidine kinase KdpD
LRCFGLERRSCTVSRQEAALQISKIAASADGRTFERRARGDRRNTQDRVTQSQALVPLQPQVSGERTFASAQRPAAPFVAHLIATHIQAPQTRARRRAEPEDVIAAYSVVQPVSAGNAFRKSA